MPYHTDDKVEQADINPVINPSNKNRIANKRFVEHDDDNLILLIDALEDIDTESKLAKLNATSFVGKDGLRILY